MKTETNKPLTGRMIYAGDLIHMDDETPYSGVVIEIDRETLRDAGAIPLYQDCVIIPQDAWDHMRGLLELCPVDYSANTKDWEREASSASDCSE